jgi:hypothetical protein
MKTIVDIYEKIVNEDSANIQYDVVRLGGSIGEKSIRDHRDLKGVKVPYTDKELYTDKSLAQEAAKRLNKVVSPGEKKYYGIKYVVAEIKDGKYTGK